MANCQVFEPGGGVQGKEVTLFVGTGDAGTPVFRITGPSRTNLTYTFHEGTGMYDATFVPFYPGNYELSISLGGEPIQGSPFVIVVAKQDGYVPPAGDASRVVAGGLGLQECFVDEPAYFSLDTSEAGVGVLEMEMEGPAEALLSHAEEANEPGKFSNEYIVQDAGDYTLRVHWSGQEIPGSPFSVTARTA